MISCKDYLQRGNYKMNEFMNEAIKEAYIGIENRHGGPFGSVIVKDGKIVGRGHNEVLKNNDPTCHGEMMAIRDACKNLGTFDLSGCDLYTSAEPCIQCLGAILWANINKVYYGCSVKDTDSIGFRDEISDKNIKELRTNIQIPLMRDRCLKLFEDYVEKNPIIY
jgi:guanine deaminase